MCNNCNNEIIITSDERFINLHVHSNFSILDALPHPSDLVKKAKKMNQHAIAITEHGNLFSSIKMYKECKKQSIKYIHGCEVYVAPKSRFDKDKDNKYYHMTILAKSEKGRLNLNQLVTKGYLEGFYSKPRIDFELLKEHKDGLIILSGCMAGEFQQTLANGDIDHLDYVDIQENDIVNAKCVAKKYKDVFGDDYYLEVQSHRDSKQRKLNRAIVDIANDMGISYVATADTHMVNEDDFELHGIFIEIGQSREAGETYLDTHLQSESDVMRLLQPTLTIEEAENAVRTTRLIADKCDVHIPLSAPLIPHVEVPFEFKNEEEYLKHLCNTGWKQRGIGKFPKEKQKVYMDRLMYEFNAVRDMGFIGYFLLVYSYVNSVERRGIARGSGGGCLIAYLLNIVDVDPVKYGLYFERFIDVGQLDLLKEGIITPKELKIPDVDSDFGTKDREKVVQFIEKTYTKEKFASLGQFGYIWDKSAIKDIGRVLNADKNSEYYNQLDFNILNNITKDLNDLSIQDAREEGYTQKWEKKYPLLFKYAEKIAGIPRSFGVHPCFTEGQLVMTNTGHKEIQNVQKGDYVLTHNNQFKIVHATMTSESDDIYEVRITGSDYIKATGNHPFYVREKYYRNNKRMFKEPMWKSVEELDKNDMIGIAINQNSNIPSSDKYNLPFENKYFWWFVGRYIGDGWTNFVDRSRSRHKDEHRTIVCANKNGEIKEIENIVSGMFKYTIIKEKTTDQLLINNKDLFDFLNTLGRYAYGKKLTNDVLDLPKELLEEFLNGYFTADGYVDKDGYQTFKTVSKELAYGLQSCIHKVYNRICGMTIIPESIDIIEGRMVNAKKKYSLFFKKQNNKKDRSFYENGYIWTPFKSKCKINNNKETVYNLSVVDDNSYTVNNFIVHNCGKVVSIDDSIYYHALAENEGHLVFQMDMDDAEDLGLVKIDALGLRTVDVIYDVLDLIKKKYREYLDPAILNFDDERIYKEVFQTGFTNGVFQFESSGMQKTLKNMIPTNLDDLAVANALYRPGAMKYIDNYIARKHGVEEFEYLHSDLEEILRPTFGIIVFQEQLIEIGRLAGMRNPDEIRKATAKKKPEMMAKVEPQLKDGLKKRGWTQEQVDRLWLDIIDFAKYSFNKSHSVAYAIIAYMCGYLKVYHPKEFMTALFNSFDGKPDRFEGCYQEAKRLGVNVMPISFENPEPYCALVGDKISYGLKLVKHCNMQMANDFSMFKDNEYEHFVDLLVDLTEKTTIDSRQMKILISLDFFNKFGHKQLVQQIYNDFKNKKGIVYDKKHVAKTKAQRIALQRENETELRKNFTPQEEKYYKILENEKEYYGFIRAINPKADGNTFAIIDINDKYTPILSLYNIKNGEIIRLKVKKKKFYDENGYELLFVGDIIHITGTSEDGKWYMDSDGNWKQKDDIKEAFLETCKLIERNPSDNK